MAINLFSTSGIMDRGQRAYEDANTDIQGIMSRRTNMQAGRAYAGGDRQGAARMLAQGGNINDARTLENDIQGDERQLMLDQQNAEKLTYDRKRDADTDRAAKAKENLGLLQQLYQGAQQIPWQSEDSPQPGAKRFAFVQKTLPILQQAGFDVAPFASLTPEQLDDENVATFGGQVENEIVKFAGGYDVVDPRTKAVKRSVRSEQKAPMGMRYNEDGVLENIPGYIPSRAAVAGATRAPNSSGGGGRGGGGGLSGVSTQELIAALRGAR